MKPKTETEKQGKKKPQISRKESFANNVYALKFAWGISKSRFLHTFFKNLYDFVSWIFFSAVFNRYLVGALEQQRPFSEILTFILIVSAAFFLMEVYYSYVIHSFSPRNDAVFFQRVYDKLYKKARNVELMCYEDAKFYNSYTMAVNEASQRILMVLDNSCKIVLGALSAVYVFSIMYQIDHWVVLFAFSPLIGYFVFGMKWNRIKFDRYKETVKPTRKKEYVNRVMYLAEYAKELRQSKVFRLLKKDYDQAAEETVKVHGKYLPKLIFPQFAMGWMGNTVIYEGVLLYAAYRCIVLQNMSLADLAVLTGIMVSGAHMLRHLAEAVRNANENGIFVKNLREFLEYEEKIPEDADGINPGSTIDTIEFRDVSFAYRGSDPCIQHLSFTIHGGDTIALVGHNGAGKTTITKLLFRLYDPTEGQILLNGVDIRKFHLKAYRKLFAAAFQDYRIFAMSVQDNVLMGNPYAGGAEEAEAALKKSGVYDKIQSLPKGMDTILTREFDDEGAVLSGGQYQKIVVARAFAQSTPVCVFDEPSSALDPVAEYDLYQSIMEESKGKTMVFISHRLSSVRNATMVYMLEQGRIIEQGTHEELMQMNGGYAEMYRMQANNYLARDDEGVYA